MYRTRMMLGAAWVPLLSGCMMWGGMGHAGGLAWMDGAGYAENGQPPAPLQRAQASTGGLTITLAFPTPGTGVALPIDAWLSLEGAEPQPVGEEVWLRIQAPDGTIHQVRMQRPDASAAGTYRAYYRFPAAGLYLVTAEGRARAGTELQTASVTAGAEISRRAYAGHHDWLLPAAVLGGVGMVAWMAIMMGGSWF